MFIEIDDDGLLLVNAADDCDDRDGVIVLVFVVVAAKASDTTA